MSKLSKMWLVAVAGLMAALVIAALALPRSFQLIALSDVIQCLLLLSGTIAFIPLILRSRARTRLFWVLITLGTVLWLSYQLFWTYYEVVLRKDVPDLCTWDAVLFLHIVPFMAAIAVRPQRLRDEYSARVGRLDFALLLVWWFYLYVLIVMPWQYVMPDVATYNRNLNDVYVAEKIVLLAGLLASCFTPKKQWRKTFIALFGMTLCYSASSTIANWAIARKTYYSGSLYDIPLVLSMACLTWIGLTAKVSSEDRDAPQTSTAYGVWVARCSMIAVFSLPLLAAWGMTDQEIPPRIRVFRLALTLLASFCMGVMILVRQQMLDRELVHLLTQSRDSFDNLKRLQAQLLQSEKLASIGQLVGGAAHELNNPLTAMLGYSDLLLSTQLTTEQRPLATKIGQHVRRARSLVASLISFARQAPGAQTPLDLNTLARTAVKLTEPQWKAMEIKVSTQLDNALPKVMGDSNQMLQVCLQLVANALHVLDDRGGKLITLSTEQVSGWCVLQITTDPAPATDHAHVSSPINPEEGLGLSACHGIMQEHRGKISRECREDGTLLFRMELPPADLPAAKSKESTVPVLWQSQPYA